MIRWIDDLLNRITMYRLVLYYLIFLLLAAFLLSVANVLTFDPFALLLSTAFLLAVCAVTNRIFARVFGVTTNVESVYISALILALIITPPGAWHDLWFLGWAAVLAMASKYILALRGRHVFNPVAVAVALTYFGFDQSASWWVGSGAMLVFVLLGGLLVVRKLGRADLVLSFLISAAAALWIFDVWNGTDLLQSTQRLILYSPLLFFAFIILTEPQTTPATHAARLWYGALTGFLFAPQFHLGGLFLTPELSILVGNALAYAVNPRQRLMLRLKEKTRLGPDTYEFVFPAPRRFAFTPGQYMEWTLGHDEADSRGNRRYFTLASAPTEHNLKLGVKFYEKRSSFKRALLALEKDGEISASELAGEFVLPSNSRQKCVLIAGGIGITPFRSMIKYLLDTHQRRPIVLFYAARSAEEFVYKELLDRAQQELGIQVVYTITDARRTPAAWPGKVGRITPELIRATVPEYRYCWFYLSGARNMVRTFQDSLLSLGITRAHIKTDYFAGLV